VTTNVAEVADGALVARCRAGDTAAWDLLVDRFSRYVHAICTQGFRLSQHDAEDAFQDVFAKVYEQLPRLRDDEAIRPWIAQLTRRTCIDRLRAGAREQPVDAVEPRDVEELIPLLDRALTVRDALAVLSPDCREMLDRFFARDESYRQIGAELDLPAGTIASRISRCLAKLRTELEDSGAELRQEGG